jgi:hypothetical protein
LGGGVFGDDDCRQSGARHSHSTTSTTI